MNTEKYKEKPCKKLNFSKSPWAIFIHLPTVPGQPPVKSELSPQTGQIQFGPFQLKL